MASCQSLRTNIDQSIDLSFSKSVTTIFLSIYPTGFERCQLGDHPLEVLIRLGPRGSLSSQLSGNDSDLHNQ